MCVHRDLHSVDASFPNKDTPLWTHFQLCLNKKLPPSYTDAMASPSVPDRIAVDINGHPLHAHVYDASSNVTTSNLDQHMRGTTSSSRLSSHSTILRERIASDINEKAGVPTPYHDLFYLVLFILATNTYVGLMTFSFIVLPFKLLCLSCSQPRFIKRERAQSKEVVFFVMFLNNLIVLINQSINTIK